MKYINAIVFLWFVIVAAIVFVLGFWWLGLVAVICCLAFLAQLGGFTMKKGRVKMEEKDIKFFIIKIADAHKYLDLQQKQEFEEILTAINKGRTQDGKQVPQYLVCNMDEPYAPKVLKTILNGEKEKAGK